MTALTEKVCTCCEESKAVALFYRNPSASSGHSGPLRRESFCKFCSDLRRWMVKEGLPSRKSDVQAALVGVIRVRIETENARRTAHEDPVYVQTDEKTWRAQGFLPRTYLCALILDGKIERFKIGKSYDPEGVEPRCQEYAIVWDKLIVCSVLEGDHETKALEELKEYIIDGKRELCYAAEEVFMWFYNREDA